MNSLYEDIIDVLVKDTRLVSEDGILLKNKILELTYKLDNEFIDLLFQNEISKNNFFKENNGFRVFDSNKFIKFINNKAFLPDSYTSFKNKIGLTDEKGNYISEEDKIVLSRPYKDCVLAGGQSEEDAKRDEIFYNEVLAKDQIDKLLDPKVFTNFKKYTKDGEQELTEWTQDENGNIKDNLIIKGNNLLVISSLLKKYEGKIKLIIIDPPYNTNTDSFKYNDKFSHSTWLVFMKNRLEIAKKLLSDDGSIYVQIDNKEAHYLKVLMDDVFGRNNFRSEIIWDTSIPYVAGNKWLSNNWIYSYSSIFYYAKNKENVFFNKLTFDVQQKSGDISHKPYKDVRCDIENFAGFLGAKDIKIDFNSRKPEKLLERMIKASSKEGDIVMDFFGGSGTTLAAAHKMNRKYIGVEQMNNQINIITDRLQKVIEGDDKGISKSVNWKGGGEFVYMELMENNMNKIEEIQNSNNIGELISIYNSLKDSEFINYTESDIVLDLSNIEEKDIDLFKKYLIELLDKNALYVNYSDIEDTQYGISNEDKKLNNSFYN